MTNERDIVERLAEWFGLGKHVRLMHEAAAEIARLRSELEAEREAVRVLATECNRHRGDRTDKIVGMTIEMMAVNANPLAAKAVEGARK